MDDPITIAWPPLRKVLVTGFTFSQIIDMVGLAGLDTVEISEKVVSLKQSNRMVGKGTLLSEAVDIAYGKLDIGAKERFLRILTEEVIRENEDCLETLRAYCERLGWTIRDGNLIPLSIFDPADLQYLPEQAHEDLLKAATRLRDGDLSGAVSAACGAVDSVTSAIYEENDLAKDARPNFQKKVNKALEARAVFDRLADELMELNWDKKDIDSLLGSLKHTLSQSAHVMETIRRRMADVHGTKVLLPAIAFDSIKWASLIVRFLAVEED